MSLCTSSKILSAFLARTRDRSSDELSDFSRDRGASAQGYYTREDRLATTIQGNGMIDRRTGIN